MSSRFWAIGVAMGVGLAVTACGGSGAASTPPTTAQSSPSTRPSPSGDSTSNPTSVTVPQAACQASQLRVAAGKSGAAGGSAGQTILFTNIGQNACSLMGYPGVAALNAQGVQVAQAQRRMYGMFGGVFVGTTTPLATLQSGQTASAEIEGVDHPVGSATSCPVYLRFLVTPPGETHSVAIAAGFSGGNQPGFFGCAPIIVNPVVPGMSGSLS
jgi:hypothetical protein